MEPRKENLPEAVQTPLEADNFTKSLQENIPYEALEPDQRQKRPTICGLRRKVFWTAIILVILAVVGAAVGGGVGGSLSSRNHKATTAPSLPTPAPPTQFSIPLQNDATAVNGLSIEQSGSFLGFSIEISVADQVGQSCGSPGACIWMLT